MIVADKKREQIIEGAIKRFSHFGIGKTTMNDIAEDLSVSKPSLYYYFPDKKHLILGVIEKIFNEFFEAIQKKYNPELELETILFNTIDVRNTFFQKYYMLKIAEVEFEKGNTVKAADAQPHYVRDTVTWKKLPGRE